MDNHDSYDKIKELSKKPISSNGEQNEALQAEMNKAREELKKSLSPIDRENLECIESVCSQLSARNLPFYLFVGDKYPKPDETMGIWQFNQLAGPNQSSYNDEARKTFQTVGPKMFDFIFRSLSEVYPTCRILLINDKDEPIVTYYQKKSYYNK